MPPAPVGAVPPIPGSPINPAFVSTSPAPPQSFWERVTTWVSDNKALVYTIAGVVVVVTGAGTAFYLADSTARTENEERRASKKERRKAKKDAREKEKESLPREQKPAVTEPATEPLPEVDEQSVEQLQEAQRKEYAAKFKAAGNQAYGKEKFAEAIDLYSKAILCNSKDPIFFSNRAACYNAQGEWQKVVEDTTHALNLSPQYVKALNRRAKAYEQLEMNSEALLDYTASCIIDSFRNDSATQSVERLLKKVAEQKAKRIQESKGKKLPSAMFITNYLQSFRKKPAPEGLEESAQLEPNSGLYNLQQGLLAMDKRNAEGYAQASSSFDQALELGELGEHEAIAHNLRGTFRFLKGENQEALEDLTKSIQLQPSLTQSYIKRASMHLEGGDKEAASADFEKAVEQNKEDPDIYYHRAQLHFILGEYADAAKDYQKSIDLDRDFIFSHVQLGVTQYKMGSIASSMATFRRCVKNFDRVPDVYNYYGELLLDQQKFEEAVQKFDTAIDMEKKNSPGGMNVLPVINKALALFQWKQDFTEAEKLCGEALTIDPECDIAVATMAQLLLQQGKVTEALKYFERAAELARTEGEIANALSYAEATRTQLEVQQKYPELAAKLAAAGAMGGAGMQVPGMMG